MKVHAFRLYQNGAADIEVVLRHVRGLPYEERLRTVYGADVRLEFAEEARSGWLLDFSVARRDGPGRIGRDRPIESFELDEDDGFGEETAAYLDKTTLFCAVQYNHFGPKARHIQGYLGQFARVVSRTPATAGDDQCSVVAAPVLRDDAAERLMRKTIVRKLEFQVHVPEAEGAPARRTLTGFLDAPITSGARTINVDIAAGREDGATLAVAPVRQFVSDILGLGGDLAKLRVRAKDDEDSPTEPLDFIAERLEKEFRVVPDPVSRRYDRNERWNCVARAHEEWARDGELR
ncbi:hypothetical protein [Azospirillum argentinense]|uniref:DUF6731 family protein n=1 Tax=Azospirillum argentinense TaxID=2970906 RepID=UPI0032DF469E